MKNIKTIVVLAGFFILVFEGCRPKPIDIDIKPHKPKLVVASQILPGNFMVVGLSMSFSSLANSTQNDSVTPNFLNNLLVKDAFVTVSYSNKMDTLFMLTPGIYLSRSTLQQDYGFYTLLARDPATNEEIKASSILLPQVKFDTIYPVVNKSVQDTSVSVQYQFTDIPNQDNWYVVNYYLKQSGGGGGFSISNYFNPGSSKLLAEFELLSDKTFNDGKYSTKTVLKEATYKDSIAVSISNISEGYYKFLTAFKRSGSVFNQLSGEPINYPTNVTNGYGYFNTHYPTVKLFDLNKY
jgi:hypothetical protein